MKNKFLLNISLSTTIIILFCFLNGCKSKGDDPGPGGGGNDANAEVTTKLTSGTWIVQSVTVDNVDRTSSYAGMTLSFTSSTFSSTNGAPVWPASGSWTLDFDGTSITRGDGLLIIIQDLTTSSLKLGLVWTKTTYGPGKTNSIAGNHVFTFSR